MTHYFETPSGEEHRRTITARFWDTEWTFTTASGVFSHDGLDLGEGPLTLPIDLDASAEELRTDQRRNWVEMASSAVVKLTVQPQVFSKPALSAGPGPHSAAKLS